MSTPASQPSALHIAIIMDGNGRWAKEKHRPRVFGHREGAKRVHEITTIASRLGIGQLTLYALSTENLTNRPPREIAALMKILKYYVIDERELMMREQIRFRVIGDLAPLPKDTLKEVEKSVELTSKNSGMTLCLAINYGSRDEIRRAVVKLAEQVKAGTLSPEAITEQQITDHLDTAGMPEPDLLIRTAMEQRLSNYLLWQLSYAEFYFTPTLWPDFKEPALKEALAEYTRRTRKFGGLEYFSK